MTCSDQVSYFYLKNMILEWGVLSVSLVINDVISDTCLDKIVLDLPITFLVCCRSRNGAFSTVFFLNSVLFSVCSFYGDRLNIDLDSLSFFSNMQLFHIERASDCIINPILFLSLLQCSIQCSYSMQSKPQCLWEKKRLGTTLKNFISDTLKNNRNLMKRVV